MTGSRPPDDDLRRPRRISRRTALLGGLAALGTAACGTGTPPAPVPSPAPAPAPPLPPTPSAAPVSQQADSLLDDVPTYTVLPGEVEPACKQAAVAFVTAALTSGTPSTAGLSLARRLDAVGQHAEPAAPLKELLPTAGASGLKIVYPQYGGFTPTPGKASVMVVAEQTLVGSGRTSSEQRRTLTLDVRLSLSDGRWRVDEVRPAQHPVPAPSLSPAVQKVLESDQIVLPDAARADLLGGGVHDVVAEALLALADGWRVHVLVLTGGHPVNVWNTDKVSNHTRGKAVDVWALNGVPVLDQRNCPWPAFVAAASAAGATEIGSPRLTPVPGGFTDKVHHDHVHLGFGRRP